MPIVINEFEIIPEPEPGEARQAPARAAHGDEPPVPEPREILRVEHVHLARLERVRAD